MNRLKLWAYAVLVLAVGTAEVVFLSRWLTERSLAQLDRELHAAVAQVDARSQLLVAETAQLADAVSRDPALARALVADGGRDAIEAVQTALQNAQRGPAVDARPALIAAGTKSGVGARAGGAPVHLDADAASLVASATGRRAEGYAFVGDALFYVVAVPAGQGASVAVGLPIDGSWLALVRAGTGCGVTLLSEGRRPRTTLSADDLAAVMPAAQAALGHPASAGALPGQRLTFTALPLPAVSVPFVDAPAFRAQAVAMRGLPGASLLLSLPTAALLAPVASYAWLFLGVLALLAAAGAALGFLITNEQRAIVPKELVAAADRIARGDLDARAPELAGSLGTVASALNRAAAAAQARSSAAVFEAAPATSAAAPAPAPASSAGPALTPTPSAPLPIPAAAAPAAPILSDLAPLGARADDAFAVPSVAERLAETAAVASPDPNRAPVAEPPAGAEAPPPAWALPSLPPEASEPSENGSWRADPFASTPPASPFEPPALERAPESRTEDLFPVGRSVQAAPPDPFAAPAAADPTPSETPPFPVPLPPPALAGASSGDEEHWRAIYEDFLRVRSECGEGASALAFDRFRQKLVKNREQLVEKYRCRTVKFQVYVKEGKAALKATPVR